MRSEPSGLNSLTPRFSVIVSNYNYADYVAEAVDSALAQSHLPLQIIVVDDGSSDGSLPLLRARYAENPLVEIMEKTNGGQLSAFQAGMRLVRGEVTCFLDADDRWQPDYLAALAALYAPKSDIDFVYGNLRFVGAMEGTWFANDADNRDFGLTVLESYFGEHWRGAPTSALSLRSALALRLLALPDDFLPDWRSRADDVLVYGAGVCGARKYYLAQTVADYRVHENNAWLRREEDRVTTLRHRYRVRRLLEHFGREMGLSRRLLSQLSGEIRTRRQPSWSEVRIYLDIIKREGRELGWLGALEARRALVSYFLRERLRRGKAQRLSAPGAFPRPM